MVWRAGVVAPHKIKWFRGRAIRGPRESAQRFPGERRGKELKRGIPEQGVPNGMDFAPTTPRPTQTSFRPQPPVILSAAKDPSPPSPSPIHRKFTAPFLVF